MWQSGPLKIDRVRLWLALAAAAVCAVALRDISLLLGSIQNSAYEAYSASVITKPRLVPWASSAEILNAWTLWDQDDLRNRLVVAHLVVDVVFIGAYGYLLWRLLRATNCPVKRAGWLIGPAVVADLLENVATL